MRATPSLSRLARTMTRPASRSVMCEVSMLLPSAMPTRSAPSSRALSFISWEVGSFLRIFILALLEFLELLRDHALVAFFADPAHVPLRQPRHVGALLASLFKLFLQRNFFCCLLRYVLLELGESLVAGVSHLTSVKA